MSLQHTSKQETGPYDIFMLFLCIFTLILLSIDTFLPINDNSRIMIWWFDTGICAVFFFDFVQSLVHAKNRLRYLYTWGWIDLLSSIPSINILRLGRTARIFRIFRLLRGVRASRFLARYILNRRRESAFLSTALLLILMITMSSIAVLQFEVISDSNIKTPGDAVWWALTTMTTVGYGDKFPVTSEGRVVGVILMFTGVGMFGILSGFVASWFLSPIQKHEDKELDVLRRDISELKTLLKDLHRQENAGEETKS
jgi:voltage-gated potassium channel